MMKQPQHKRKKKQYDKYVTYFSVSKKQIIGSYCGAHFVAHCQAIDLLNQFFSLHWNSWTFK